MLKCTKEYEVKLAHNGTIKKVVIKGHNEINVKFRLNRMYSYHRIISISPK